MDRDNLAAAQARAEAETRRADQAEAELERLRSGTKENTIEEKKIIKPISVTELVLFSILGNFVYIGLAKLTLIYIIGLLPKEPNFISLIIYILIGYFLATIFNKINKLRVWPHSYRFIFSLSYALIFLGLDYLAWLIV